MSKLGQLFKTERKKSKITQKQLAQYLGWSCGQTVSNYENDVAYPPFNSIKKIHQILKVKKSKIIDCWQKDMRERIEDELG